MGLFDCRGFGGSGGAPFPLAHPWVPAFAGMTEGGRERVGSGGRGAGSYQLVVEVQPRVVGLLYQFELPASAPFFERLFPADCAVHAVMGFVPNELIDTVLAGESPKLTGLVLPYPLDEVGGHAGVQGPVPLAGDYVDARLFHGCIVQREGSGFPLSRE